MAYASAVDNFIDPVAVDRARRCWDRERLRYALVSMCSGSGGHVAVVAMVGVHVRALGFVRIVRRRGEQLERRCGGGQAVCCGAVRARGASVAFVVRRRLGHGLVDLRLAAALDRERVGEPEGCAGGLSRPSTAGAGWPFCVQRRRPVAAGRSSSDVPSWTTYTLVPVRQVS